MPVEGVEGGVHPQEVEYWVTGLGCRCRGGGGGAQVHLEEQVEVEVGVEVQVHLFGLEEYLHLGPLVGQEQRSLLDGSEQLDGGGPEVEVEVEMEVRDEGLNTQESRSR